jgi:hypothetical protein
MPVFRLDDRLVFPPVHLAEDGLLALGGDLRPERLLLGYTQGIFPWYAENLPILWHSPDPRMVMTTDDLIIQRSLRKAIKKRPYEVRIDTAFEQVLRGCAESPRPGQTGTWLIPEMIDAYLKLHDLGFKTGRLEGTELTLVGVYGDISKLPPGEIEELPGVDQLIPISRSYKRVAQKGTSDKPFFSTVNIGKLVCGGADLAFIAGPCSVESESQIMEAARIVKEAGCGGLRGGVVKYRSSPYSGWEGLGASDAESLKRGLALIVKAGRAFDLPTVGLELVSCDLESLSLSNQVVVRDGLSSEAQLIAGCRVTSRRRDPAICNLMMQCHALDLVDLVDVAPLTVHVDRRADEDDVAATISSARSAVSA